MILGPEEKKQRARWASEFPSGERGERIKRKMIAEGKAGERIKRNVAYSSAKTRMKESATDNKRLARLEGKISRLKRPRRASRKKSFLSQKAGTPELRSTIAKFTGTSVPGASQGRVKRGRGRPPKTYDVRFLPGVGMVKMPIQAYKRALSAAKAKIRYRQELKQAQFATQAPPDQTGRGLPGEFAFAEEPDDFGGGADMMPMEQDMGAQPQGPNFMQRMAIKMAQRRQMQGGGGYPGQGYPGQPGGPSGRITLLQGQRPGPRMNVWGGSSMMGGNNILNSPNIFNRPGDTTIGVPRR